MGRIQNQSDTREKTGGHINQTRHKEHRDSAADNEQDEDEIDDVARDDSYHSDKGAHLLERAYLK